MLRLFKSRWTSTFSPHKTHKLTIDPHEIEGVNRNFSRLVLRLMLFLWSVPWGRPAWRTPCHTRSTCVCARAAPWGRAGPRGRLRAVAVARRVAAPEEGQAPAPASASQERPCCADWAPTLSPNSCCCCCPVAGLCETGSWRLLSAAGSSAVGTSPSPQK